MTYVVISGTVASRTALVPELAAGPYDTEPEAQEIAALIGATTSGGRQVVLSMHYLATAEEAGAEQAEAVSEYMRGFRAGQADAMGEGDDQ